MSLGFQKAGMEVVAAFDNWVDALTVYRKNFSHPAIRADLMNVEESVKAIRPYNPDMIIGGPPCQDFSSAGKRNENNGRGDLTVSYAKIVSEIKPVWFVMENVERILKTQNFSRRYKYSILPDMASRTLYSMPRCVAFRRNANALSWLGNLERLTIL